MQNTPREPTELRAEAADQQVTLRWEASGHDGFSVITHHEYRQKYSSESFPVTWTSIPTSAPGEANATSFTVLGLSIGITYDFQVRAVNAIGPSAGAIKATAIPVTVPNARAINREATVGDRQVTLSWVPTHSWSAPASGGSPITRHEYRQRTGMGIYGNWTSIPASANALSFTVTGLTNGITYTFQVRAVNDIGESDPSNERSATPVTVPSAPTNLEATVGDRQVTLRWDASASTGGSPITGHEYRQKISRDSSFGNWTLIGNSTPGEANATGFTVLGLTSGEEYTFQVRAVNVIGESDPSNEISAAAIAASATPVTVPSAPPNLEATVGDRQVTLRWDASASTGGSLITGHEYRQ